MKALKKFKGWIEDDAPQIEEESNEEEKPKEEKKKAKQCALCEHRFGISDHGSDYKGKTLCADCFKEKHPKEFYDLPLSERHPGIVRYLFIFPIWPLFIYWFITDCIKRRKYSEKFVNK